MSNTKITNVNELASTKYLNLYELDVTNKVGDKISWIFSSRKKLNDVQDTFFNGKEQDIDAVIVAPIHKESGKLVLINQFRMPINDYIIELPAGLIDNKEDFKEAVKREVKEETGLDVINIDEKLSKKGLYMSPGMTDESVALVYCSCSGELNTEHLENDEEIEPFMVSKEEAVTLLQTKSSRIDIKAYLVIQDYINGNLDILFK